jgi:malonate-semialdehyde dehydrogenase (acetylating)/methylmalonate-semialdehyde dehydrogenase
VSFVGSTPIAKYIYETGTKNGKRVQALGGAKNHMVVLPDADLELAADFRGERGLRLGGGALHGDLGARHRRRRRPTACCRRSASASTSSRSRPGTSRAPRWARSSRRSHHARVVSYVDKGEKEGAKLLEDGRKAKIPGHEQGFFLGPCLFDAVKPEMSIYTDEIFGPGAERGAGRRLRPGDRPREREPLRQRRRDLHERRRCRAPLPERGPGRHGRE